MNRRALKKDHIKIWEHLRAFGANHATALNGNVQYLGRRKSFQSDKHSISTKQALKGWGAVAAKEDRVVMGLALVVAKWKDKPSSNALDEVLISKAMSFSSIGSFQAYSTTCLPFTTSVGTHCHMCRDHKAPASSIQLVEAFGFSKLLE